MPYLLDSNVFMQAKRLHYGFDFCPAFWDWLIESNTAAKVFSVEKVADEIDVGGDDLSDWASDRGPTFFLTPGAQVLPALQTVSTWVNGQGYGPSAVNGFLQVADFYLVAHALAVGYTVVTHEKPGGGSIKKVQIPDVCIGLGVKCVTPFEMLRAERARFVLPSGGQSLPASQPT
jgi:hypothetical protein